MLLNNSNNNKTNYSNDLKVYISTGFFKKKKPLKILKYFIKNKIFEIEFSSGQYANESDLKKFVLKSKKINARIHNYFPPPKKPFVINLASQNKVILNRSINQIKKSIILSKKINGKYFSFHAGFRIDPEVKKIGKNFLKKALYNKKKCESTFLKSTKILYKYAKKHNIKLLIENNVITKKNLNQFKENPLLLTNDKDIKIFFKKIPKDIKLLLDIGHLQVSANTENFNLIRAINNLNMFIGGYHLSNNNSINDQNLYFGKNFWFIKYLKNDVKYITLEIYQKDLNKIKYIKNFLEKKFNK